MTTTVFYPSFDGYLESGSPDYANMRAGAGLAAYNTGILRAGQAYFAGDAYYGFMSPIQFDTVSLTGQLVTDAAFALYGEDDNSTTDFTCAVGVGPDASAGGIQTTDWLDASTLAARVDLATLASSAFAFAYMTFTGNVGPAVNVAGKTNLWIYSTRMKVGTTPTGSEYLLFYSADEVEVTERRPRLTVTHEVAPPAPGVGFTGGGFFR